MITDKAGRTYSTPNDLIFAIQRGEMPGLSVATVRGKNPDIDTAASEDVIPWGGLYAFQAAAVAMQVISSSASDDGAPPGIGARTVRIEGLDGTFNPITEDVILNGTTAVACVNTYRRINRFYALTAGSSLSNVGTIDLRVTAGAVIQAQMPPGEGQSRHGVFTVPTGRAAYIVSCIVDIRKGTADDIEVVAFVRSLATVDAAAVAVVDVSVQGQGTSTIQFGAAYGRLAGPADLFLRGQNPAANNNGLVVNVILVVEETT